MQKTAAYLLVHPDDNVLVALKDLPAGLAIDEQGRSFQLITDVKAKHKFTLDEIPKGAEIKMYGVVVGTTLEHLTPGTAVTLNNIQHASAPFALGKRKLNWTIPDVTQWQHRTFDGFHRADGSVGTANYWLIIPLVFCENHNVNILKDALLNKLGYKKQDLYEKNAAELVELYKSGASIESLINADLQASPQKSNADRLFPNLDGIKFLTHDLGCGGTRSDSDALCGLLAGYITHPNVAGATVLSLGCQHAQVSILKQEIDKRDANFQKPLIVLDQQKEGTTHQLMQKALKQTFAGLVAANKHIRKPAPLSKLCVGLECGGSDGFSGISANPAVGLAADMIVALGGSVILAEFPELCGVEQELSDRCVDEATALRFNNLMQIYNQRAEETGSGFYANPSPGNIRDGLITDAIKSAGAAKKAGNSPVTAVLDYPEKVTMPGLTLLCTPGNDVESTTAEVAAGANVVLFTTGLGTPTGNPVAPVMKLATNSQLAQRMPDIIDIDCGPIIDGTETLSSVADRILEHIIAVASGRETPKAVQLGQDDFIPWKRGVSL